jgi:hypothetical protein
VASSTTWRISSDINDDDDDDEKEAEDDVVDDVVSLLVKTGRCTTPPLLYPYTGLNDTLPPESIPSITVSICLISYRVGEAVSPRVSGDRVGDGVGL